MGILQEDRQTIESYLDTNFTETSISWDNIDFNQNIVDEFIAPVLRNGRAIPVSVGGSLISYESPNTLVISIFTKKGTGSDRNREIADELISLFLKQQMGAIFFEDFQYISVGDYQEWYRGNLLLHYRWKKCI